MFVGCTRLLLQCVFVLLLIKAISSRHQQQLRRVCYFTNWSCDLLVKEAYFCLHDLDASLCSHIIFAFAGVNVTSLSLAPTRLDDESVGNVKGRYVQFNEIKKSNPGVKTLLSAGGSYQAEKFKLVTSTNTSRARFADNTARYVRQWGFDGLDLDWEYPGKLEKEALTYLVKDLKSAFREEASRTGQPELLLSIAVPVGEERVRLGYQVDLISKEADMINLMAYDFYYGAWAVTAFNSPLYPRNHHGFSRKHSVEWIVNLWINLGAPPHKINLGIAAYGQSFTLQVDPREPQASEIQTANNRTGAGLDQKIHNTTTVLRNILTVNDTLTALHNNFTDSVKGNIQSLLSVDDPVQKTIPPCNGNVHGCVTESHLFQNSRRKRDRHGSFFQDLSATNPTSDILITRTNSDQAGSRGSNSDEISVHENGIGSQELDSRNIVGLRADREMLSHEEFPTQRNGHSSFGPTASSSSVGGSHWQGNRTTDVYRDNSKVRHSTDGVVYGVGSKAVGPGRPGRLRHLKGQLSYPEICERIHAGAEVAWDQEQRVPYAILGDQWVGYENTRSVAEKVTWAFDHQLGGVMLWSLDLDDFKGSYCGQGRFPLLTSMSTTVISLANQRDTGVHGRTRHFTSATSLIESTDAVTAQEPKATPVFDNTFGNAIERPFSTVAFPKNQNTTTHQIMTTPRLFRQHVYEYYPVHSVPTYKQTTDLPSKPTDVSHLSNRHSVDFVTPVKARHTHNGTITQVAENTAQKANTQDDVTSTRPFQSHGRKLPQPTDLFPSTERKQSETADLFPPEERKQSEQTDLVTSKERKQSDPTDLFPNKERKQSHPTDFLPPNDKKQSQPTNFLPPNDKKQSQPTDFLPPNDKKQSHPTDFLPPNDKKQSHPTDFLPPNDKKQSHPTDFLPPNDKKQSQPTDFLPPNDKKQSQPTDFLPPNDKKQSQPTDFLPPNDKKQSQPTDFLPPNDKKQSQPTDFLPPNDKKQSQPTDFLPPNDKKQSQPTDFLPPNDKKQSQPTDFLPPNDKKQSQPTDFLPPNDKKQSQPTDFLPPNDKKQSQPTDFLPPNDKKQSQPTDFLPPNNIKQSKPTNLFLSNETKQSEPSPVVPSTESNQSTPTDLFISDEKTESEISNNDYDYTADTLPTTTITTVATTTTHKSKIDKRKKSSSKSKSKKRLYRNTSSSPAASISEVVCIICVVFFTVVYS